MGFNNVTSIYSEFTSMLWCGEYIMNKNSMFEVNNKDKCLAPLIDTIYMEFKEGDILSKNDISLITLQINLSIEHAKNEYKRGYNDGYYEGKGVSDREVYSKVKEE